ncbi:MAG: DNA alkylation repair protein [Flavobacteriales bacterium]|nr:DNA alkylation repair protein [Flavobacteriales bacterium]
MAAPLKEMFNRPFFEQLARETAEVAPGVDRTVLLAQLLEGNEGRELNARMRHASTCLRHHLPADFRTAVDLLKQVVPRMPRNYTALLFPDLVGLYGLQDPAFSLSALKYFTAFGSAEFAVREFLRKDVMGTLQVMRTWAEDRNEHVRRLASEGCRPRLPWSFRLDAIIHDPTLTTPILAQLRADDSPYVRRSVANHLNDLSKDHPEHMLGLLRDWGLGHPHTEWIAKHACRTLIKAGDKHALELFAFDAAAKVHIQAFDLVSRQIQRGGTLEFSFTVVSQAHVHQQLVVDYAIHYRKASGRTSRKVFKLKEASLAPGASLSIAKRQRMVDLSTRKHFAGEHLVEVLVNGKVLAQAAFVLAAN